MRGHSAHARQALKGDARGDLTSHRARSTIASQLANARDPMSLFELMEWLGHKSPQSTVHYVKSSLANQVKHYEAAGCRDRNLRSIAVLVNRKALNGAGERDEGGIYYDLGHGYCRHEFFAQCPHRLACVRCPFYEPKDSQQLLILEAEGNLIRLRQDLYLTEEEQAVIDGDVVAYRALRGTKLERAYSSWPDAPSTRGSRARVKRWGTENEPGRPSAAQQGSPLSGALTVHSGGIPLRCCGMLKCYGRLSRRATLIDRVQHAGYDPGGEQSIGRSSPNAHEGSCTRGWLVAWHDFSECSP